MCRSHLGRIPDQAAVPARNRWVLIGTACIEPLGRRSIEGQQYSLSQDWPPSLDGCRRAVGGPSGLHGRQHRKGFRWLILGCEVRVTSNGVDGSSRAVGSVAYPSEASEASVGASPQHSGQVEGIAKARTRESVHATVHERQTDSVCQGTRARDTGSQSPQCLNSVSLRKVPTGALPWVGWCSRQVSA